MLTGIASHRPRRDVTDQSPPARVTPLLQTSTLPEVEGIAPLSADRSDLIRGLQITDQRLLLNQFQALNQQIQELISRQPTLNDVIEQQLAQAFGTAPPVDPATLYVHRYDTDEHGQRRLLSVQTITQALFDTLLKLKTSSAADASAEGTESGFYIGTAPADSDQQLNARGTLISMAQALEKALPLSLARFWTEPRLGEANPESPQTELLAIHREMLSTLAALQVQDGTLTPAAKTLIDQAFQHPNLAARESAMKDGERPGVYPLKLDTPRPDGSLLAGAFLLTSSDGSSTTRPFDSPSTDRTLTPGDQRGLTVLYTPRDGYEVFDSPAKALQTLRQRISDYPDAAQQLLQSLPLATQQSLKPGWKNELSQNLTPLTGDVIAAGVPQLLEHQRQQVNTELQVLYEPQSSAMDVDPWRQPQVQGALEQASDLGAHFDGANALWARTERLLDRLSALDGRQLLDQQLEDRKNWQYLAQQLNQAGQSLAENAATRDVSAVLKNVPMNVAPGSTHYQTYVLAPGKSVSLEAFVRENGLPLPNTRSELLALAQTAAARAQQHPFGNFGGGLSWPIPLSLSEQQTLRDAAIEHATQHPDAPQESPALGVLDYLNRRQSLSATLLEDPVKVLEALVSSTDGQALGLAMQTHFNGISTPTSVNDYTLAAINLALDPEALTAPRRNWVAGYNLADKKHWGKPLSAVFEGLTQRLIDTQRASPALAKAGAHLLLMRAAPHLLVKDIPDSVVYGSVAWANLCIAAAAIEAQSPGRVASMTFAEVMITAADLPAASTPAQTAVVLDWAVTKNILAAKDDGLYTQDDIDEALAAFNHQQEKLKEASALLDTPMPDREQLAEALLQKEFGENVALDDKIFAKKPQGLPPKPGKPYSMREILMEGVVMDDQWAIKNETHGVDFDAFVAFTKRPESNIQKTFDDTFATATTYHKTVKKLSIVNALTNLPPDDQKNLSHGKLNYYQEKSYKIGTLGNTLFHTSPKILVTAENDGALSKYEFDTEKGLIKKLGNTAVSTKPEVFHNEVTQIEEFFPDVSKSKAVDGVWTFANFIPGLSNIKWVDKDGFKRNPLDNSQPSTSSEPYLFTNRRALHLADSVVKALDLDNPAIKKAAAGTTSSEHRAEQTRTLRSFFLDLIPFRSAIVNFIEGNYSEGVTDVAFDIFGFITAGIGAAAKAGKVLNQAGSALSKALKVTKIMVPPLLKELNPFDGVGDLLLGAGKVAYEGGGALRNGMRTLKGTANRDALILANKHYDAAATGSIKVGDSSIIGNAVKQNDHWYKFNADSLQPYGAPADFTPTDTLMPAATKSHTPTSHRARPYPSRPPFPHVGATKEALPAGDYVEQTAGKLIPGHFIPGNGMDQTKARFTQQMEDYYTATKTPGALPVQPTIPSVPKPISPQQLITETLQVSQGVVFGEHHSQMASFKLLMDSMQTFVAQGVKKVYFEGVIDLPGVGAVDDGISNLGNLKKARTNPTYQDLVNEFKKNGIDVLPLDHYYLTRHKDDLLRSRTVSGVNSEIRLKEFNYYAAETIQANSGTEKWVALVGNAHMNTSEGVTGLAELTGTLGIGVFDNANVPHSMGLIDTRHIPDPAKPLKRGDLPGNLHIYMKP